MEDPVDADRDRPPFPLSLPLPEAVLGAASRPLLGSSSCGVTNDGGARSLLEGGGGDPDRYDCGGRRFLAGERDRDLDRESDTEGERESRPSRLLRGGWGDLERDREIERPRPLALAPLAWGGGGPLPEEGGTMRIGEEELERDRRDALRTGECERERERGEPERDREREEERESTRLLFLGGGDGDLDGEPLSRFDLLLGSGLSP